MVEKARLDIATCQGEDARTPLHPTVVVGTDGRADADLVDPDDRERMRLEARVAALREARRSGT